MEAIEYTRLSKLSNYFWSPKLQGLRKKGCNSYTDEPICKYPQIKGEGTLTSHARFHLRIHLEYRV